MTALRRIIWASLLLAAPASASELYVPRGDNRYQRVEIPDARGDRLRTERIPGTDRAAIYDSQGRRVGEARTNSWDRSVTIYDNQGRRISR